MQESYAADWAHAMTALPPPGTSGARRLAYRLRSAWEKVRPFRLPRYPASTPRIGGSHPLDPFFPPTAPTLGAAATSEEAYDAVEAVIKRLTPSPEYEASEFLYAWGHAKFGKNWRFADILTMLWAAATFVRPANYLEIGVFRGRSASLVASVYPQCSIYGFDLWIPEYAGAPNPGPHFVRDELRRAGHTGTVVLESGDSRRTVPAFLGQHPDLYFDLITVDGAKSVAAVATDFANALPRLKVGGIVVTDDLPMFPRLRRVWNKVIRKDDSRYVSWEFADAGYGVSAAIRVSE